ncbi:unnamed protein product, partial [Rotaria sp. Silwood1]
STVGLTGEVAHKWANVFINGNFVEFINDGRSGKRENCFYDVYPEIEVEGKAFAVIQCNQKVASFTAYDLAQFIGKRFYEINDTNKSTSDLVRSVESCRLSRSSRRGHTPSWIHPSFLTNKDHYYSVSPDEDPHFQVPTSSQKPFLSVRLELSLIGTVL